MDYYGYFPPRFRKSFRLGKILLICKKFLLCLYLSIVIFLYKKLTKLEILFY